MPFWKKKDNLIIAACVVLFCLGLAYWSDMFCCVNAASRSAAGGNIAQLPLLSANNKTVTLNEFRGKPLIINFWATWCPVCVRKMADLDAFAESFEAQGGKVITVSEDMSMNTVVGFLRQNGYIHLPPYLDQGGKLMSAFGVVGLPTSVFINAEGREVDRIVGGMDWKSPLLRDKVFSHFAISIPK